MLVWAGQVRSDDADNLEARAAAYYWKNLFPEFPDFVRGRFEEPPNNLLNYGYAIPCKDTNLKAIHNCRRRGR